MDTLPPTRSLWIVLLILFGFSILFACAEQSTVTINDSRLKRLSDDGNHKAARLMEFLNGNSGSFMAAMQFIKTILLLSVGVCSLLVYLTPMAVYFTSHGMNSALSFTLSFIIVVVLVSLVYLALCVFIPKGLAGKHSESMALFFAPLSIFITYFCTPFVCIPNVASRLILTIFGVNVSENEEDVTEEEIRMMVDIGSESGAIDDDEKEMIHNIFEMDDKPVEDIMTHRTDAVILWINDGADKWEQIINETNHTRYPVCGNAIDDVVGIINSRDFYKFLLKNRDGDLREILRAPYFVPESIKADEMFSRMQDKNAHFAIVLDEYGGFRGIVTQEDLIEEIVGELHSEYDEPEQELEIYKLPGAENTWVIAGSAEIEDVEDELNIKIPYNDGYNTFAGLILDELGAVPADGETPELAFENLNIKVTKVSEHRIEETVVTLLDEKSSEDEDDSDIQTNANL